MNLFWLLAEIANNGLDDKSGTFTSLEIVIWAMMGVGFLALTLWALISRSKREAAEKKEHKDKYKDFTN